MWKPKKEQIISSSQDKEERKKIEYKNKYKNLELYKFRYLLKLSGYEDQILEYIAKLSDPKNDLHNPTLAAYYSSKLNYATEFERDDNFINFIMEVTAITQEELDALWIYILEE